MRQEELFVRLSEDLQNYTTLDVGAEWPFGWDLHKDTQQVKKPSRSNDSHRPYDIRKDRRLRDLLKPMQGDPDTVRFRLQNMATTIVAGLSRYNIYTPDSDGMEGLMKEAGVTAGEMNDYAEYLPDEDLACLGSFYIRPITLILHKILWDAMSEGCGLTGWSWDEFREERKMFRERWELADGKPRRKESGSAKKRRQQYIKKGEDAARRRLRRTVDYLMKRRMLRMDLLKGVELEEERDSTEPAFTQDDIDRTKRNARMNYEDFFYRYALLTCKQVIAMEEL